jgi:phospholipid N-methyltransferase
MDRRVSVNVSVKARPSDLLLFAQNFVKHPKMLGSVIPSSRFLVNRLLGEVDWPRARVILEYGPGVGTFTREILRRMSPDGALIVFETNGDFVRFLRRRIDDPRLQVVHGSAADAGAVLRERGVSHADYVISGIPYSTMPAEVRDSILQTTGAALRPDGVFLVYQFTRAVLPSLMEVFGSVREEFEPRNVMPARLFYCRTGPHHRERETERRAVRRSAS